MAASRPHETSCRIVKNNVLKLETKVGSTSNFSGVVVIEDKLLVIDYELWNLQIYNLQDGKLVSTSHRLESYPMDICAISTSEVAVCLLDGLIVVLSWKIIDDIKLVNTLDVRTRFRECHSLTKLNSGSFLVSGCKDNELIICWSVVSIADDGLDSANEILENCIGPTHIAIKENTMYISCPSFDSTINGVYAYDIFNPQKIIFLYRHLELKRPWSIMAEKDSIFVCDFESNRIHQVTNSGQLLLIHRVSQRIHGIFYDEEHAILYTTSYRGEVITVYTMEHSQHPGHKSIQLYEETLKGSMESVYEYTIRIMVVGCTGSGKTTLLKRLLGEKVNDSESDSTSGIQFYVDCCDASLSTYEWTRKSKVQVSLTQTEPNDGENIVTGHYSADPSLRNNPNRTNQNATNCARITILDIAGNYAFSTFPSKHAVYLMVLDTSRTLRDNVREVEIWMNTIHSLAPPAKENVNYSYSDVSTFDVILPPVILVGTHIDQIPKYQTSEVSNTEQFSHQSTSTVAQRIHSQRHGQSHLKKLRSYLKGNPSSVHLVDEDFVIDNTIVDKKLEKLKKKIVEVASHGPYWRQDIPTRWFLLKLQLIKLKDAGAKVISHSTVEQLNKEGAVQINTSEELDLFLNYLHENGTIIYFSIEVLREIIILDPQWLIYALESIINAHSVLPAIGTINALTKKWPDFKEKGVLSMEIVDAVWTQDKHPELHAYKDHLLRVMEQFNIIFTARSFSVIGEKVENYFLAPCMLRQESPPDITFPEKNASKETTPEMHCIFTGKYLPAPIFHRLLAACIARWPVAKNMTENLIFCGCCVFYIDLFHRLTVYNKGHVVCAKVTRLVIDEIKTPDVRLCSNVRRFITLNLDKIISYLGLNLEYELVVDHQTWFADEGHDPDVPITPEHMNYARLLVALVTIFGKAMREILRTHVPTPYTDIYQAILANKAVLTTQPLLNPDQICVVFPDPLGQNTGKLEEFDMSLLYILIRNISTVQAPSITGWGAAPVDQPSRDTSLGASVERIRSYRNHVSGHTSDGKISPQDFQDYWNKFEAVLHDIEAIIGGHAYSQELQKQKRQVISVYEAC